MSLENLINPKAMSLEGVDKKRWSEAIDGAEYIDTGNKTILETLPEDVSLTILEDQAIFIEAALSNLRSTAVLGAVLAVVILFLFLKNFRATAIIGAAIPMSIVVTFIPMYLYDVSLNLMSLGGLALGIGMLVDNAVVALENIQVHFDKVPIERLLLLKGFEKSSPQSYRQH